MDEYFESLGFSVIRFEKSFVFQDADYTKNKIKEFIIK